MARLEIKATPSAGVGRRITLVIDHMVVGLDVENKGAIDVAGSAGDQSVHKFLYGFEGNAGDTLSVTISCAGAEVCKLKEARITPASAPYGGGFKVFSL